MKASPFVKPSSKQKRLKLFVYGGSGAGKTTFALSFPNPAVIDLEGGTDHYGRRIEEAGGAVMPASTADEVRDAVRWLSENEHPYRTLVIDPFTVYWEALQKKWADIFLQRNQRSKGNRVDWYEFQPRDWSVIKGELKELCRELTALDMNVIATAREKALYAEGELLRKIGETFDGEKSLPYLFDTVIRLEIRDSRFAATVLKDRTHDEAVREGRTPLPLGRAFEAKYETFVAAFGAENLTRPAQPSQAPATPPAAQAAPAPANGSAQPPANAGRGITDAQRKRLFALAREQGLDAEGVKATMARLGLPTSTKELTPAQYDRLCAELSAPPPDDDGYAASLVNGGGA